MEAGLLPDSDSQKKAQTRVFFFKPRYKGVSKTLIQTTFEDKRINWHAKIMYPLWIEVSLAC